MVNVVHNSKHFLYWHSVEMLYYQFCLSNFSVTFEFEKCSEAQKEGVKIYIHKFSTILRTVSCQRLPRITDLLQRKVGNKFYSNIFPH